MGEGKVAQMQVRNLKANSYFVDVVTTAGVGWTMAGLVSDQIGLAVIRETKDNKIQQQTSLSF